MTDYHPRREKKTCGDCRFSVLRGSAILCVRFPPAVDFAYPKVGDKQFACGEFRPNEDVVEIPLPEVDLSGVSGEELEKIREFIRKTTYRPGERTFRGGSSI